MVRVAELSGRALVAVAAVAAVSDPPAARARGSHQPSLADCLAAIGGLCGGSGGAVAVTFSAVCVPRAGAPQVTFPQSSSVEVSVRSSADDVRGAVAAQVAFTASLLINAGGPIIPTDRIAVTFA